MAICRSIELYKYLRSARYASNLLTRSAESVNPSQRNYRAISPLLSSSLINNNQQQYNSVRGGRTPIRSVSISSHHRSQAAESESAKGGKEPGKSLLGLQPNDFVDFLKEKEIRRCYIVYDKRDGLVKVSHPELEEFAEFVRADEVDYDKHEGIFLQVGRRSDCLMGAFVWRTNRGQAVSHLFN